MPASDHSPRPCTGSIRIPSPCNPDQAPALARWTPLPRINASSHKQSHTLASNVTRLHSIEQAPDQAADTRLSARPGLRVKEVAALPACKHRPTRDKDVAQQRPAEVLTKSQSRAASPEPYNPHSQAAATRGLDARPGPRPCPSPGPAPSPNPGALPCSSLRLGGGSGAKAASSSPPAYPASGGAPGSSAFAASMPAWMHTLGTRVQHGS